MADTAAVRAIRHGGQTPHSSDPREGQVVWVVHHDLVVDQGRGGSLPEVQPPNTANQPPSGSGAIHNGPAVKRADQEAGLVQQ